jgi:Tfp pilus assembly protein PilZ
MPSPTNRRRHARVKPKQLASRLAGGTALHLGLPVDNISMGGIYVRCLQPLPAGTKVSRELTRPGSPRPIPVMGRVVSAVTPQQAEARQVAPGMGIAFDELPPHIEVRIEGVVAVVDPDATRSREHAPLGEGVQLPTGSNPAIRAVRSHPATGSNPALPGIPQGREVDVLRAALAERDQRIARLNEANKALRERIEDMARELTEHRKR